MANSLPFSSSSSLRSCRDLIKGRRSSVQQENALPPVYTELRRRIRSQYPPMKGERLRKTALATVGTLAILLSFYVMLAA